MTSYQHEQFPTGLISQRKVSVCARISLFDITNFSLRLSTVLYKLHDL